MSYVQPKRVTYTRTVGTSDAAWTIAPPAGCNQARVVDINASVTTTYNAVTTSATLGVGVAGNTAKLGELDFGTTAAAAALGFGTQYVYGTNPVHGAMDVGGTSNTITGTPDLPKVLGPVLLTFTANTGGSPAGAAIVDVTIDWS